LFILYFLKMFIFPMKEEMFMIFLQLSFSKKTNYF
jgi:hypothetical protein